MKKIEINHLLRVASRDGEVDEVKGFLSLDPDIDSRDENGDSALMLAARNNHIKVCKLLIKAGALEQEVTFNKNGHSSLAIAEANGCSAIYRLIEERLQL